MSADELKLLQFSFVYIVPFYSNQINIAQLSLCVYIRVRRGTTLTKCAHFLSFHYNSVEFVLRRNSDGLVSEPEPSPTSKNILHIC